jgi:predicted N-acetyltransferase YhbS
MDRSDITAEFVFKYPQFIPTLAEWHYHEWGAVRNEGLADSVNLLSMSGSADALPLVVVALRGDKPVGMGILIAHDIPTRPDLTPWLAALYVPPVERNKGIGSFLASTIAAEANRLGHKHIYLFTHDKIAFYERLGWKLSEIFPYRGSVVAIMLADASTRQSVAPEAKSSLTYVIHLHNYVYGLKKEAEERGKSILTAAALYTASLVWFIKFATDVTRDTTATKILTLLTISFGGIGFLFVIRSLLYALKTFAPQVVDASSPLEPLDIVAKPLLTFEEECSSSLSEDAAKRALAHEIYAVSQLQIRRSAFVLKASRLFAEALGLLVLCVFCIIGLYLVRWGYDLEPQWPENFGRSVTQIVAKICRLFP